MNLFEFIYIFNNIIFIYNIYIISRLKFDFEFEYDSIDIQVESNRSRILSIFYQAKFELEILMPAQSSIEF